MKVANQYFRSIWPDARCKFVDIIDQTKLPFAFEIARIESLAQMLTAIKTMQVRGAPLIGVAAAYGVALAMLYDDSDESLKDASEALIATRPTAVNLQWAVSRMVIGLQGMPNKARNIAAWKEAAKIAEEDVAQNQAIGQHGFEIIKHLAMKKIPSPLQGEGKGGGESWRESKQFNIMTHCNAGWLATVDFGTALAPIYAAHDAGLNVHVWVSETRPRNQGAALTAWELAQHGVKHTVISDNAAGHLMQKGLVDMVIVGADRVTANGDVCNKIGTYLKALAAHDCDIPFYAAVPSPTIDWDISNHQDIEIEERHGNEVATIQGLALDNSVQMVRVIPHESNAANPAFDVTPARLVTGIITEKGVFSPNALKNNK